jgi:hypothetical protein
VPLGARFRADARFSVLIRLGTQPGLDRRRRIGADIGREVERRLVDAGRRGNGCVRSRPARKRGALRGRAPLGFLALGRPGGSRAGHPPQAVDHAAQFLDRSRKPHQHKTADKRDRS